MGDESEALQESLGYDDRDLREDDEPLTEFEKFLEYHGIDEMIYQELSNNQKSNYWWNFRKLGKRK